jgi:hypothetical protein
MAEGGIKEVRQYPLGDDDIRKILGNDIKIWNYPQLKGLRNINEMFDAKGRAILLFPNVSPTSGHWTCLINRPNKIEFFDSYGDAPDTAQKDGMTKSRLEMLDVERPYLTRLLRASGKPVFYNNRQFQKEAGNVATCGRHCCVRLLYAPYSIDKYNKIIESSGMSPDDFVSGITYDKLRK